MQTEQNIEIETKESDFHKYIGKYLKMPIKWIDRNIFLPLFLRLSEREKQESDFTTTTDYVNYTNNQAKKYRVFALVVFLGLLFVTLTAKNIIRATMGLVLALVSFRFFRLLNSSNGE